MKKNGRKIAAVVVLLLAAVGTMVFFAVRNSPEYALLTVVKDVKTAGLEGLKPHLTGDAQKLAEKLDGAKDSRVMDAISSILNTEQFAEKLKDALMQIEWSLDDIEKSAGTAGISLEFNYKDRLTGEVELNMIRENGEWKISGFDISDLNRP